MRRIPNDYYWSNADVVIHVRIGPERVDIFHNCYKLEYGFGMVEIQYKESERKRAIIAYPLRLVEQIECFFPKDPPVAEETTTDEETIERQRINEFFKMMDRAEYDQTHMNDPKPSNQLKPGPDGKSLFG